MNEVVSAYIVYVTCLHCLRRITSHENIHGEITYKKRMFTKESQHVELSHNPQDLQGSYAHEKKM